MAEGRATTSKRTEGGKEKGKGRGRLRAAEPEEVKLTPKAEGTDQGDASKEAASDATGGREGKLISDPDNIDQGDASKDDATGATDSERKVDTEAPQTTDQERQAGDAQDGKGGKEGLWGNEKKGWWVFHG